MRATITIPETLNEISLVTYQRWLECKDHFTGNLQDQKLVSLFCAIPLVDTLNIKQKDINSTSDHLKHLLESTADLQQTFTIKGKHKDLTFGFIPNLDEISGGEYADLDTYLGSWENMHKAMAVMYRPVMPILKHKEKYLIENYEGSDKYSELMKFAPLNVVFGALLFFWNLSKDLSRITQDSLNKEILMEATQLLNSLRVNGDGMPVSTLSQEEILNELKALQNTPLENV